MGGVVEGLAVRVSSRFRTPAENAALENASPQSQHLFGLAWDLTGDVSQLQVAAERARAAGYVPVFELTHLHIQRFPAGFLASCGAVFPT